MLEKLVSVDQIEVTSVGCVQVRVATIVVENGEAISQAYHRHVIAPGDDYSNEDERVKAICAATHTSEVIEAYRAALQPE